MKALAGVLVVLLVIVAAVLLLRYTSRLEFFSSPKTCRFVTLGTYKLTTTPITAVSPNGQIYISSISSTPSVADWANITNRKTNDQTYTYTDFSPLDLASTNVKSLINAVMSCKKIPEFSNQVGINSSPALILCLQSYTPAVGTVPAVLSRVFFVKSFVPSASVAGSNVIVGEIGGNTQDARYNFPTGPLPVAILQGAVGTPSTALTYTLSYTICDAGNRPEGFSYTDCCSAIDSTTPVVSYAATSEDTGNCSTSTGKDIGAACSNGPQCSSGTCRNGYCVRSSSISGYPDGHSCATQSECTTGLKCVNNICKRPLTKHCYNNPGSYDPNSGKPCSEQVGPYLGDSDESKGSWKNWDWGTKDENDIYNPKDWYNNSGTNTRTKFNENTRDSKDKWYGYKEDLEEPDLNEEEESEPYYKKSQWSGYGNRWRGSDKNMDDQNENVRPQRFNSSGIVDSSSMQPSFATCNKYYNCKKQTDTVTSDTEQCDDGCE